MTTAGAIRALRGIFTAIAWLAFLLGVLYVVVGVARLAIGWTDNSKLAHPDLCGDGRVRDCLDGHDGRVVSVGSGNVVKVTYDDDRSAATFEVAGKARLPVGAFVRVELWGGTPVSFTDGREHRYKDSLQWPGGYPGWAFIALGAGGALMLPAALLTWRGLRRPRRR